MLRKKSKPVKEISNEIKDIINKMIQTMKAYNGIGLAANQLGYMYRIITINTADKPIVIINPRVTKKQGSILAEEGCLSLPGLYLKIKRANFIIVEGYDQNFKNIKLQATNLISRAIQHEIDHLNGVLFIDRLPILKRIKIYLQLRKEWKKLK